MCWAVRRKIVHDPDESRGSSGIIRSCLGGTLVAPTAPLRA
ncbi:MAG: hypothetical protein QME16_06330 [Planctomycetota bacterium]|nr:hypothetical protein [Planctomycetota bacterium]